MSIAAVIEDAPARVAVIAPGVYELDEAIYHADPVPAALGGSLSCSGTKLLLPPSVPAKFDYYRRHPKPPTAAMEFGSAAHRLVLGTGPDLVRVGADSWRTNYAKAAAAEARARGAVPLLSDDYETALLSPERGKPEQSIFWRDAEYEIWRRSRLDLFPDPSPGYAYISDYKTCASADPESISKAAWNYGYYRQDPFYRDGFTAICPGIDVRFLFIFQEKEPPFLVNVIQLSGDAVRAGREANRAAIEKFCHCTEAGIWPGYQDEASNKIGVIGLPRWAS
jgi:hypothetical protein